MNDKNIFIIGRKNFAALCVVTFFLMLIGVQNVYANQLDKERIYDYAGLLSSSEEDKLAKELEKRSHELQLDLVVLTTDDDEGKGARLYAEDFYVDMNLGYRYNGTYNTDGVLFLIDMDAREAYIVTEGVAIDYISDSDIDRILDGVMPELSNGNYLEACENFVRRTVYYSAKEAQVKVEDEDIIYDEVEEKPSMVSYYGIRLAIALAVATIVTILLRLNAKAKMTAGARDYIRNGFRVISRNDIFINTTVTKVPIPKETSSSGGSSHSHSSGRSFGGGGRGF